MKSVLITNSGINQFSGGGIVSYNLLEVLKSISKVELILCNEHFHGGYEGINSQCLDPRQFGYDDPFFYDYFANSMVRDKDFSLAMTYGCPFGLTVERLKRDSLCKVICDLAPHNIAISREEHLKWAPNQYPFPHLTNQYLLDLYLKQLQYADKVIVHSHSSAEYIQKEAKLTETPLVIPHGCYLPLDTPEYPEKFQVGYFGSLGKDKGIIYLLSAITNTKLDLFIGGREACLDTSERPNLHILGEITPAEFYKNVTVYVQPSVIEGFGITPLEAMAFRRPVIVSEGAGMSELITDGKDGFVVPRRDITAIVDKLIYFQSNTSEIKRMGKNARETAEKYSWDTIKERYIKECKNL